MITPMSEDKVKVWLHQVLSGLVSYPDQIEITRSDDEMGVKYTVKVAPEDRGKVIGKQGKVATAIRTVLRSAGFFAGMRASMIIDVPGSNFIPRETDEDLAGVIT